MSCNPNRNRPAATAQPAAAAPTSPAPDAAASTAAAEAANASPAGGNADPAGGGIDPSTRNTNDAARTAGDEPRIAPPETARGEGDSGVNLADADTTRPAGDVGAADAAARTEPETHASPTEGSPTAAEAEAAAASADHGASAFAGGLGIDTPAAGAAPNPDGLDENGLRIAVAFTDKATGQRVAPGDVTPAHILDDAERLEALKEGGFITDKPLPPPAPATAVPGGALSVSYDRQGEPGDDRGRAQPIGDRR